MAPQWAQLLWKALTFSSGPPRRVADSKPAGADGVFAPGGWLFEGERDPKLRGTNKWVTFDTLVANTTIVASAVRVWTDLGGSVKWTAEPNKRGGRDAEFCAELVTEGLLEAQLPKPWRNVVKRQLMKKFRGFALHEAMLAPRADGRVVFVDIQHRPQWTVERWDKPTEQQPWRAIEQRTRAGGTYLIDRYRLFYSVEDTIGDSPDGVGLLRHLVETARVLERYQQLEGIGFDGDLRGMPIGWAPLAKLAADAKGSGAKSDDEIRTYVMRETKFLRDMLEGHVVTPNRSLLLDSTVYTSTDDKRSISSQRKWGFETVRSAISGMPEVGTAIARLTRELARVMCAEWLLLGGEDSGGAYSMHADKTAMFGLVINASMQDLADDGTRDLAARLVARNGFDPELCTPRLVPQPIPTQAIESACRSLLMLSQATLHPLDTARDVLRSRMDLPPAPEVSEEELMLPRGSQPQPAESDGTTDGRAKQPKDDRGEREAA